MTAFAATGTTLVVLLFASALGTVWAKGALLDQLREATPTVKRWSARVLMAVGVWLVILAGFADTFAGVFPV